MRAKDILQNGKDAASRLDRSLQRIGINLAGGERYYQDIKNKSIEKEKEYKSQGIINVSPKDVHDIADEKGIPWDNEPKFLELSQRLTGTAHLDDMDQKQLVKIYKHLYDLDKNFAEAWSEKYKRSINCSNPKGFSQRAHCQGRKKNEAVEPDEPGYQRDLLTMPKHTLVIDTPGELDWYKIGQHFPNLGKEDPHEYGQSETDMVINFASKEEMMKFAQIAKRLGFNTKAIGGTHDQPEIHSDRPTSEDNVKERLNRTGSRELVIFDIDDTLLHTTAQIKVINKKTGKEKSLTNQQFNNYKLQSDEEFDFGEFRNAKKFEKESVPIGPMLDKLRADLNSGKNVVMLTARADFDDQPAVYRTFKRHGIDINKDVHLYRAGNLPGDGSPAAKKAIHVSKWLSTGNFNKITMYDDSEKNLYAFKFLEKKFPDVDFEAHHVSDKGETKQVEERKRKRRWAAYGPGPYGLYGFDSGYSGDGGSDGGVGENFADGNKPGRKGLAKRSGVPTKASVSRLRQIAKSSSGEKQRMAHWLANMKAGKKK